MKTLHERMIAYTARHTRLNEAVYSDFPDKVQQAIQRLELVYDDLCKMVRDQDPGIGSFVYYKDKFEAVLRYLKILISDYSNLLDNGKVEEQLEPSSSEFVPDTVNLNEPTETVDVPSGEAINSTASQAIADMLIKSINDEWTTISEYNTLIANAEFEGYDEIAEVIRDINKEENIHVGQLQAALETLSSQTKGIEVGEQEGEEQLA